MRIVIISFHFAEYAMKLACALAKENNVFLILRKENVDAELGRIDPDVIPDRMEVLDLPFYKLKNLRWVVNIVWLVSSIRSFKPDIIHVQENGDHDLVLALLGLRVSPMVLTIHDPAPHSGQDANKKLRTKLFMQRLRKQCNAAIVHGEKLKCELKIIAPYLKDRIHSIRHGVLGIPIEQFGDNMRERGCLLFFGRIEAYKGLGILIDAVNLVSDRGIQVKVVIAGRGRDLDRYRSRLVNDSRFELHERFIPRKEAAKLMLRADIIVMPYLDATQSGVAAMALGYGRPVIASNVGSVREMVRHDYNGLLVPPRDAEALADAIAKLVGDDLMSIEFGKNSHALAQGAYSWQEIAVRTQAVYLQAVSES